MRGEEVLEKEILNMQEVCELLNVSEKTMIKVLQEEDIPARKIGREWRFSKTAIIEWIGSGNSVEYKNQEDGAAINRYEKDTSKLLELLDRVHEKINVIKKNTM